MDILAPIGIIILSLLIMSLMQLTPGVFLLFSHFSLGKYSHYKTSHLALFYIIGVETVIALLCVLLYLVINATLLAIFNLSINLNIFTLILAGIILAIGLIFPFCYFKKGKGTELFISRKLASHFQDNTKNVKTTSDAFLLGMFSSLPELIFTMPVYIVLISQAIQISSTAINRSAIILLFMLSAILPLFIIHFLFQKNHNLADIEKIRIKNKLFLRCIISITYIIIAFLLISKVIF